MTRRVPSVGWVAATHLADEHRDGDVWLAALFIGEMVIVMLAMDA